MISIRLPWSTHQLSQALSRGDQARQILARKMSKVHFLAHTRSRGRVFNTMIKLTRALVCGTSSLLFSLTRTSWTSLGSTFNHLPESPASHIHQVKAFWSHFCLPLPHVSEQGSQVPQEPHLQSRGHSPAPHSLCSSSPAAQPTSPCNSFLLRTWVANFKMAERRVTTSSRWQMKMKKLTWVPELQDAEHSAHSAQPDQTQPVELEEVAQVTFTCNKISIMLRRVSWSKVSAGRRKTYDVDAHPSLPGTLPWLNSVQVATMPVASTGDFHHHYHPTLHYTHLQQSMHGHCLPNTPASSPSA